MSIITHGLTITLILPANCTPSEFAGWETPSYAAVELDQDFVDRLDQLRRIAKDNNLYDVRARRYAHWFSPDSVRTECDVVEVDAFGFDNAAFSFAAYEKHTDLRFSTPGQHIQGLQALFDRAKAEGITVLASDNLDASQEADAYDCLPCLKIDYRHDDTDKALYLPAHRIYGLITVETVVSAFTKATGLSAGQILSADLESRYTVLGDVYTERSEDDADDEDGEEADGKAEDAGDRAAHPVFPQAFAKWQAAGRDVDDLSVEIHDESLVGVKGRLYPDKLYIGRHDSQWWLLIGREETLDEHLAPLEAMLFDWAVAEGIVEPDSED